MSQTDITSVDDAFVKLTILTECNSLTFISNGFTLWTETGTPPKNPAALGSYNLIGNSPDKHIYDRWGFKWSKWHQRLTPR